MPEMRDPLVKLNAEKQLSRGAREELKNKKKTT